MKTTKLSALNRTYQEESKLLRDVLDWLEPQERNGIKVIRISERYHRGYSDLFLCVHGLFVVAELKDDTGKPSLHQLKFIEDMQRCGAIGGICRTLSDVNELIEEALKRVNW